MPISTKNYKPKGEPQSEAKENLLRFAFGETNCADSALVRTIDILAISVISTLLFILLSIKPVDDLFSNLIPNYSYRLTFKGVIFFLLILLLDILISNWRSNIVICS